MIEGLLMDVSNRLDGVEVSSKGGVSNLGGVVCSSVYGGSPGEGGGMEGSLLRLSS